MKTELGIAMTQEGRNSNTVNALVICTILTTTLSGCINDNDSNTYRDFDEKWVNKAIELHFGEGKNSRENALKVIKPSVVYLPEMVCVGLNLKSNSLGADQTICFSKEDESAVLVHNEL